MDYWPKQLVHTTWLRAYPPTTLTRERLALFILAKRNQRLPWCHILHRPVVLRLVLHARFLTLSLTWCQTEVPLTTMTERTQRDSTHAVTKRFSGVRNKISKFGRAAELYCEDFNLRLPVRRPPCIACRSVHLEAFAIAGRRSCRVPSRPNSPTRQGVRWGYFASHGR